ncbi:CMP-sialic acid transporter isoform X2 [Sceloporus undulatus]|uniref:CMP-sialic acid transporter isoform X2 n=1 Tax=Sceloporus undulatus TaxID=8520 RepID=UPI001C4C86C3|nr:CMP-sialic acid transporter isoform X2 [Sceloporus undulatus]XP_042299424.1 CMP-sialic acid transporter isoform X2 [Sceloporus undulatus]
MAPQKENVGLLFKLYCLTVMTLVAATYTVALRYTRTTETVLYFSTTAVCITEVIKLFLSLGILTKETGSLGRLLTSLKENVLGSPKELLKLSVPSLVYAIQNNMAFLALSNLDAAVYQMEQSPLIGFGAIAIAVLCSGFAGVYFEKVLKSSDTSLWVRNIQMYLSGIVVTLVGVYMSDGAQVMEKGFFYGYTHYVWFVIFLSSVGGLYTSVVVKYTDNIMKGFSAAAAIVLSTIASVILFGLQITITFSLGALLVCISIYLYGLPRQDTTKLQPVESKASKENLIHV